MRFFDRTARQCSDCLKGHGAKRLSWCSCASIIAIAWNILSRDGAVGSSTTHLMLTQRSPVTCADLAVLFGLSDKSGFTLALQLDTVYDIAIT